MGWFPHHTCYVEPFCGASSVFFRKQPAEFEILNDLDGEVINFFCMLRDRSDELIRAIILTPFSRAEYALAWQPTPDPLERARRYYICAWQGWGGGKGSRPSGWRYQHTNNRGKRVVDDWNDIEHLPAIVWRLKQAFIENDDANKIIERYDQSRTLFYLDPPYLSQTRSGRWKNGAYQHELDIDYHQRLLDILQTIQGMAIISGYPSELYNERLADWKRFETKSRTTNTTNVATEVIWLSPRTVEALAMPEQMPMFSEVTVQ